MEAGGEEVSSAASYESEQQTFTSSNPTFKLWVPTSATMDKREQR